MGYVVLKRFCDGLLKFGSTIVIEQLHQDAGGQVACGEGSASPAVRARQDDVENLECRVDP